MKKKTNSTPGFIIALGWLIALGAFAIGFWHTHLGLREFKVLSSDYGSLVVASIVLMVLIISYQRAISGLKVAIIFWIICSSVLFIFNLNSFYPSYLGRKLIQEEATMLNDSLHAYANNHFITKKGVFSKVKKLYTLKDQIKDEITGQAGFGPRAKDYLEKFNNITGGDLKANINVGYTADERQTIAERYDKLLDAQIENYIVKQIEDGAISDAKSVYEGFGELKQLEQDYSPRLKEVIRDNRPVNIDSVLSDKNNQIKFLQDFVVKLDNVTTKINKASGSDVFYQFKEAKTRNLGKFAYTLNSVYERINKKDTWGVILICLFIDLLVPLAMYFLIRDKKRDDDHNSQYTSGASWWDKLLGKKTTSKF